MLKNRVIRLSIFVIIAFFIQESWALAEELTPSKEADMKRLLAITGVDDIGIQITNTFSRNIQQQAKSFQEIKSLIEFYQTKLGEKTLKLMPKIFQENLISSQQWVNKMGPIIWEFTEKKLKEKGFELPK
jgi:hypothetical protein